MIYFVHIYGQIYILQLSNSRLLLIDQQGVLLAFKSGKVFANPLIFAEVGLVDEWNLTAFLQILYLLVVPTIKGVRFVEHSNWHGQHGQTWVVEGSEHLTDGTGVHFTRSETVLAKYDIKFAAEHFRQSLLA